jgi:hypothetical protein
MTVTGQRGVQSECRNPDAQRDGGAARPTCLDHALLKGYEMPSAERWRGGYRLGIFGGRSGGIVPN